MASGGNVMVLTRQMADPAADALFSAVGAPLLALEVVPRSARSGIVTSNDSRPVERIDLTGEVAVRDTIAEGWLSPDVTPAAFGPDGLVAFIERDELDVDTVVVRRRVAR